MTAHQLVELQAAVRRRHHDDALLEEMLRAHARAGRLDEGVRAARDALALAPDRRRLRRWLRRFFQLGWGLGDPHMQLARPLDGLAQSPDGALLAVRDGAGSLLVLCGRTGARLGGIPAPAPAPAPGNLWPRSTRPPWFAFPEPGPAALVGDRPEGEDRDQLLLWRADAPARRLRVPVPRARVVGWDRRGRRFLLASDLSEEHQNRLWVLDVEWDREGEAAGTLRDVVSGRPSPLAWNARLGPEGRHLVLTGFLPHSSALRPGPARYRVDLLDLDAGSRRTVHEGEEAVRELALSPDERWLALVWMGARSGGEERPARLEVHDLDRGRVRLAADLPRHPHGFAPGAPRWSATGALELDAVRFDPTRSGGLRRRRARGEVPEEELAFDPVRLGLYRRRGARLRPGPAVGRGAVVRLEPDAAGRRLVATDAAGRARVFSLETGAVLRERILDHQLSSMQVEVRLDPSGKVLVHSVGHRFRLEPVRGPAPGAGAGWVTPPPRGPADSSWSALAPMPGGRTVLLALRRGGLELREGGDGHLLWHGETDLVRPAACGFMPGDPTGVYVHAPQTPGAAGMHGALALLRVGEARPLQVWRLDRPGIHQGRDPVQPMGDGLVVEAGGDLVWLCPGRDRPQPLVTGRSCAGPFAVAPDGSWLALVRPDGAIEVFRGGQGGGPFALDRVLEPRVRPVTAMAIPPGAGALLYAQAFHVRLHPLG